MASRSSSAKSTFKRFFSRSESNLEDSSSGRTVGLLARLSKKGKRQKSPSFGEQERAAASSSALHLHGRDEDDAPGAPPRGRSLEDDDAGDPGSKGSLSYSETDLRKKKFHAFSFGWRKKNKNKNKKRVVGPAEELVKWHSPGFRVQEQEEEQEMGGADVAESLKEATSDPSQLPMGWSGSTFSGASSQDSHDISVQPRISEEHHRSPTHPMSAVLAGPVTPDPESADRTVPNLDLLPCDADNCHFFSSNTDSALHGTASFDSDLFEANSSTTSPAVPVNNSSTSEHIDTESLQPRAELADGTVPDRDSSLFNTDFLHNKTDSPSDSIGRPHSDSPLGGHRDSPDDSDTPNILWETVLGSSDACCADFGPSAAKSSFCSELCHEVCSRDHPNSGDAHFLFLSKDVHSSCSQSTLTEQVLLSSTSTVPNSMSSTTMLPAARVCKPDVRRNDESAGLGGSSSSSSGSRDSQSQPPFTESTIPHASIYSGHARDRPNGMGEIMEEQAAETRPKGDVPDVRTEHQEVGTSVQNTDGGLRMTEHKMREKNEDQMDEARMESQTLEMKMEQEGTEAGTMDAKTGVQGAETHTAGLLQELSQRDASTTSDFSERDQAASLSAAGASATSAVVDLSLPREVTGEEQSAKGMPSWKSEGNGTKWHKGGQREGEKMQAEEQLKEGGKKEQVKTGGWELNQGILEVTGHGGKIKDNEEEQLEHPRGPAQELEAPVPQVYMTEECWAARPSLQCKEVELREGPGASRRMETSTHLRRENRPQDKETTQEKECWSCEPQKVGERESIGIDDVTLIEGEEEEEKEEEEETVTDIQEGSVRADEETSSAIHAPPGQAKHKLLLIRATDSLESTERSPGCLSIVLTGRGEPPSASPGSEQVLEPDQGMNSGLKVFSTTLKVRPGLGNQASEDRKQRVHKVSLVNDGEPAAAAASGTANEPCAVDGAGPNDADSDSQVSVGRWKVQVVEESFDYEEEDAVPRFSSYSSYLSSRSYLDAQHLPSPGAFWDSAPVAVCADEPRSPGNGGRLSEATEVHAGPEHVPGGRDWAMQPEPAGERMGERCINTGWDSQLPADSSLSPTPEDSSPHTGLFKATFVELLPSPTSPEPDSPHDMDTLVDTLKSLDNPLRHRMPRPSSIGSSILNSLPPIEEDTPAPDPRPPRPEALNGSVYLPADLGLGLSFSTERLTLLEMLRRKQEQEVPEPRGRSSSLPLQPAPNGGASPRSPDASSPDGGPPAPSLSRLEGSLLFSSYRPERPLENGQTPGQRPLSRSQSLPESSPLQERYGLREVGSRLDRLSFLVSPAGSLTGAPELSRMSVPPPPQELSPLGETARLPVSPGGPLGLHRGLGGDGAFRTPSPKDPRRGPQSGGIAPPERTAAPKYRAFPDAYLTKEKEHGKMNPRPGKMYIYDRPGLTGQRIEVRSDVIDATSWELPESISIRVVKGGWVLYEKPDFKGEKIALDEGDVELTYPFAPPEERQDNGPENGLENGEESRGEQEEETQSKKKFVIGSLRRAVRDYSVPDISLFPEENAEGKKVIFRDTSEDARIFGFPIRANSIIINAGLWLVFAQPFFEGAPRVLEVGGYPNPASWGVSEPYVGSLHPLKIGEPTVEFPNEPKLIIYEKPYFTGKSREIYTNTRDFITRADRNQSAFMYSAGSIQVAGGCWVGYEKEGFRGHQYLLEEGEYHDWRVWGGCDSELRSVRLIRADLSEPMLVLFEMPEEEEGVEEAEKKTFEVTEAIPDVELFGFRTTTSSIHVLSGAWVAYSHVDFSGNQYVLEKGFYNSCADWGAEDNRICSLQPVRKALGENTSFKHEVLLYSEPNFQGTCLLCDKNLPSLPDTFSVKSCRVLRGSWVVHEDSQYSGNLYVLPEGDYPNLVSMGCAPSCSLRSLKTIPMIFTVPSISLFGLECFEGREVTLDTEVISLTSEGFNNNMMSVRVDRGCWVLCEHSYHRGRQILLEPMEISNWPKYSELPTIGSLYPVKQKRCFFRIRNRERGHFLSVQGGVEEMKSGRVVVTEQVEGFSDLWFYQDGLIKNKLAPSMSLQVMGNVEVGSKVVLWSETRMPIQTWSTSESGLISSLTFPGLVLDIKGGKTYDRDHVIVWEQSDERPSQQWELEVL